MSVISDQLSDNDKLKSNVTELKIPTFRELLETYKKVSEEQRKRTGGRPSISRTNKAIYNIKRCLVVLGIDMDKPYTALTGKHLDWLFTYLKDVAKYTPVSAKTMVGSIQSICAQWTIFRYEQHGYKVQSIKLPNFYIPPCRYREKPLELRKKVLEWYKDIRDKDQEVWFLATMMLQFGMRNGDVGRLNWEENFIQEHDSVYLKYMPNKTKLSSGRIVHWPIPDNVYAMLMEYKKTHPISPFQVDTMPNGTSVNHFNRAEEVLNRHMRKLGFTGHKGAYELRKLCASMIYKNFGQEAAASITGDDINTVLKYYADPSSVGQKVDVTSLM